VEFPRYRTFAQSFPASIPYAESAGFIARVEADSDDIDYPFMITAHEVAHQWWGHQLMGANVQGARMLSESLAEYSALMVMEREYGQDTMRRFLAYELRDYLRGRSRESDHESPLMFTEDQRYVHYPKGSMVFYALRDYLGEDTVNGVLRGFLDDHRFQGPPYPTSKRLVESFRAATPEKYRYLITDLFETITLYDNRASSAIVSPRSDGRFEVTLEVSTTKLRADGMGRESEVEMADWIDIGVFAHPQGPASGQEPLYLAKHLVSGPTSVLRIVVDQEPRSAGIDPYHKLIDRRPRNNVTETSSPRS
jgi:aminopeptidase N